MFFHAGGWPVGILFVGLFFVYVGEFFVSIKRPFGDPLLGLAHLATGAWLMYLFVSTTLNIASGFALPGG